MTATAGQVSAVLPPGLLVEGTPAAIRAHFPALCPLQPVRMAAGGLVCAPRSAPEIAGRGARGLPAAGAPAAGASPAGPTRPPRWSAAGTGAAPATCPRPSACASSSRSPARASARRATPRPGCAWRRSTTCRPGRRSTPAAGRACSPRPGSRSGAGRCWRSTWTRARSTRRARSLAAAGRGGRVTLRRGPLESLSPRRARRAGRARQRPDGRPPRAAAARRPGRPAGRRGPVGDPGRGRRRAGGLLGGARPAVGRRGPRAAGFAACGWAREPGRAHLGGARAVRARHQPDHPPDPALPGSPRVLATPSRPCSSAATSWRSCPRC